jgi:DNA-binding NtrC family response regulator
LKLFHLALPPLREQDDDIPLLAHYYLELFGEKYQRPIMPWASDFAAALLAHSWPGNVRELRDAMERLVLLATGPNLTAADVQQCFVDAVLADNVDGDQQISLQF